MGLQGKEAGRRGELAEKTQQGWAARLGSEAGEKPEAGRPGSRCLEQEEGVAHHVQCCE